NQELSDIVHEWMREGDVLEPLRSDRKVPHRNVPLTLEQSGNHLITGDRDTDDIDAEVSGLELAIEIPLEDPGNLVGESALNRAIDEGICLRVRHQKPDQTP